MKRRKFFLLIFIVFILQNSFSQNVFLQVKLEINHSLRKNNNRINITIDKKDTLFVVKISDSSYVNNQEQAMLDTSYFINKYQFDNIINLLKKVYPNHLFQEMTKNTWIGMDGLMCKLTYGTFQNQIILNIWSPLYDTKERKLEPFVAVCKEILRLANLKPRKYLR